MTEAALIKLLQEKIKRLNEIVAHAVRIIAEQKVKLTYKEPHLSVQNESGEMDWLSEPPKANTGVRNLGEVL